MKSLSLVVLAIGVTYGVGCSAAGGMTEPDGHLSGLVLDDLSVAPVPGATLTAEGTSPLLIVTSSVTAEYGFTVPRSLQVQILAELGGYRPTRNPAVVVDQAQVDQDVFLVATADATRQYTGLGLTPAAASAVVYASLLDDSGLPLEGVPLVDVQLVDVGGAPVGLGPYFFGPVGDLVDNATLAVSTAFSGRARVGFLDVPAGTYTMKVTVTGPGGPQVKTAPIIASANGATLATLQ